VEMRTKNDLHSLIKYFHFLALTIPLIICVIIAAYDVEGPDDGFGVGVCWIPYNHKEWRLLGGKVVEWSSWLFVLTCYFTTLYRLSKLNVPADLKSTSLKMLFIPAIFVILRVPSAIRTIHDYIRGESAMMWLSILQAFGDYGQGFANGIWFVCFQHEVRKEIQSYIFGRTNHLMSSFESDVAAFLKGPGVGGTINDSKNISDHEGDDEVYHSLHDPKHKTISRPYSHHSYGNHSKPNPGPSTDPTTDPDHDIDHDPNPDLEGTSGEES